MVRQDLLKKIPQNSRSFIFMFKKVKLALKKKGWDRNKSEGEFTISFNSIHFNYNHVALELVKKTYKNLGWELRLVSYSTFENDYSYSFRLLKL